MEILLKIGRILYLKLCFLF